LEKSVSDFKPGDRVTLTGHARRQFPKMRVVTGTVQTAYRLSADFVKVLIDGQKQAASWHSGHWRRITEPSPEPIAPTEES
jgi:NADPH-dependent ferric siderophore reductase